jgi:hypothetical protein
VLIGDSQLCCGYGTLRRRGYQHETVLEPRAVLLRFVPSPGVPTWIWNAKISDCEVSWKRRYIMGFDHSCYVCLQELWRACCNSCSSGVLRVCGRAELDLDHVDVVQEEGTAATHWIVVRRCRDRDNDRFFDLVWVSALLQPDFHELADHVPGGWSGHYCCWYYW